MAHDFPSSEEDLLTLDALLADLLAPAGDDDAPEDAPSAISDDEGLTAGTSPGDADEADDDQRAGTAASGFALMEVDGFARLAAMAPPAEEAAVAEPVASVSGEWVQPAMCTCPNCGGSGAAAAAGQPGGDRAENGTGDPTATVTATGNQGIDGLIAGPRWSDGFITYSDPDAAADYGAGYGNPAGLAGFGQMDASQMVAVHFALNSVQFTQPAGAAGFSIEGFTGITIDYAGTDTGAATLRFANSSDPGTAYAYYPDAFSTGGDSFYGGSGQAPAMGDYDWHTILHEIGHAMGLKHGQETDNFGAMPANLDSMEYSVMTYRSYVGGPLTGYTNEQFGYAQTYMMYDIAALQHMYGADFTTNSGNTTYTWTPGSGNTVINGVNAITPGGNRIFMTIWDGGGVDTYDLSAYATNLRIDLNPGGHSLFSTTQQANLGNGNFARGNVFNALQFNGDARSLIENAVGGSGNDEINANAANNVLTGNAGNDVLRGYSGVDTLYGGDGDDVTDGGLFRDVVYGGNGSDRFYVAGSDLADDLYGGAGNDILDAFFVSNASLGINVNLDAGTYDFQPTPYGPYAISSVEIVSGTNRADRMVGTYLTQTFYGNDGDDTFVSLQGRFYDAVHGQAGTDTLDHSLSDYAGDTFDFDAGVTTGTHINGASAALLGIERYFDGTGGNTIVSSGDSGTYYGGGGADRMVATAGGETMYGGAGLDVLDLRRGDFVYTFNMGTGFATQYPSELFLGFETVLMGGDNDTVTGSGGDDTIDGGAGNDRLVGAGGTDSVRGGLGNDVVAVLGGDGLDNADGGAGIDTLDYTGTAATLTTFVMTSGSFTFGTTTRSATGFENYVDGTGDSKVAGNASSNRLTGNAGVDIMAGAAGNDVMYGGIGNDRLGGEDGQDLVHGDDGLDVVAGGLGNDGLYGGAGADAMSGGAGNDAVLGDTGNDTGRGDEGDDRLYGGLDNDYLYGGLGLDTAFGGTGNDRLEMGEGHDIGLGDAGNDVVRGDAGNDTLYGMAGNDSVNGGLGNDILFGQDGNDVVLGEGGNDRILGLLGTDFLYGGDGNDSAAGGEGNDRLDLGTGNDTGRGENGHDIILGGAGIDTLDAGAGNDAVAGGSERDSITGGIGNDILNGGVGEDVFIFADGFGADRINDFQLALANERIDLSAIAGITGFADLDANHLAQVGANAVITSGLSTITLVGVLASNLTAAEFIF